MTETKTQSFNPYIAGRALHQNRGFFGREDIFELVASEMGSPDRNALVLFGQRRIGKTSVLLQLVRRLPPDRYLPVYFDLMDHAAAPLGKLLHSLACAISIAASMKLPNQADFDNEGEFFQQVFLPALYAQLGPTQRPVLLLDEFEVLSVGDARQSNPSASASAFFPYIRRLMEAEPHLGFIFVAGRKSEDLSIDVKAAFKTARYKRVSVLDAQSARDLILIAERQSTLTYSSEAVNRILELTGSHPYFTQLLCQLLWDELTPRGGGRVPKVDGVDVDAIAAKVPEAAENICEWIWDGLPPAEKVIYAAIAHATETRQSVTRAEVIDVLQRHGVRFLTRELELAPETLVEWEMLRAQDGRFLFCIELLRRWVALRKPLPKVKDELDRLVPLADSLYHSGDGFYRMGNLDSAFSLLQQGLTVNPNHLKARLLLGQVLVEQGKLEAAVRELDEAYRHDESAAHFPLVRALLLREEEREKAGDTDGALAICERILELMPGNPLATERWTAIWRQRGDRALAADQLDDAVRAYDRIKCGDLLEKVVQRKRQQAIDRLSRDARNHIEAERWEAASDAYKQLLAMEPAVDTWRVGLDKAENEQRLTRTYGEAVKAIEGHQWTKARTHLMNLLQVRPDYRDASSLLVHALQPQPAEEADHGVGPFIRMYLKCLFALVACLVSGLLHVPGEHDLGTTIGFYLGTALLLGIALGLGDLAEHVWRNRKKEASPITRV